MFNDNSVMQGSRVDSSRWLLGVSAAIVAGILVKFSLLISGAVPFNSDEAIVALMARHILQGERSIFFYGQAYMGSLDALLVALGFYLFGNSVWIVRMIQIILYIFTILTTAFMSWRLSRNWVAGIISALILAVPTSNLVLYTTVSLGGYGEMLLIGNLILLLTIKICDDFQDQEREAPMMRWFGLGFLTGLGLWVFGMTLVYSFAAILYLIWFWYRTRLNQRVQEVAKSQLIGQRSAPRPSGIKDLVHLAKYLGLVAIGGLCGSFPWWAFVQEFGISKLVSELGGGAIAGVENLGQIGQIAQHILNFGLFGSTAILGLRPPWEVRWLALPLAPFAIIIWVSVMIYAVRKIGREVKINSLNIETSHSPLLGCLVVMVVLGFIFTPFGVDPSGRYFLPINIVLSVFAGQAFWDWRARFGNLAWVGLNMIIAFNMWGILQVASKNPPGLTTQIDAVAQIDHSYDGELIEFLTREKEYWGYTNYWVAYPLAFHSDESLVFVPRLPYHQDFRYTERDDRYSPYRQLVSQADSTAYITTNNPLLDEKIKAGLNDLQVSWQETKIGDFRIYYRLSRPVAPGELGLGENY